MLDTDPSMRTEAERRAASSSSGTPDVPVIVDTAEQMRIAAEMKTAEIIDAAKAARLRMGLEEEPTTDAEKEAAAKSKDASDGILLTGAKLGVVGTSVLAQKIVKTGGYLFSDFFTAIERWGDEKLKKHPIARKVLGAGLVVASLPFVGWSYVSGFWASAAVGTAGVAQFRDTRPSWREQDEGQGEKKSGGGGGGKPKGK